MLVGKKGQVTLFIIVLVFLLVLCVVVFSVVRPPSPKETSTGLDEEKGVISLYLTQCGQLAFDASLGKLRFGQYVNKTLAEMYSINYHMCENMSLFKSRGINIFQERSSHTLEEARDDFVITTYFPLLLKRLEATASIDFLRVTYPRTMGFQLNGNRFAVASTDRRVELMKIGDDTDDAKGAVALEKTPLNPQIALPVSYLITSGHDTSFLMRYTLDRDALPGYSERYQMLQLSAIEIKNNGELLLKPTFTDASHNQLYTLVNSPERISLGFLSEDKKPLLDSEAAAQVAECIMLHFTDILSLVPPERRSAAQKDLLIMQQILQEDMDEQEQAKIFIYYGNYILNRHLPEEQVGMVIEQYVLCPD
ncbi:hypothetical protein COY95_00065 [Candidatus Woesearchaeota archaeon CG_4_10_14_0_8_um_filter_47_5]|nr:MAG: hypothetical protein COY95_00065 [Candidatus Woesearchaeota archaeon CG_4_10_14_0_8_um_filter_47_5]